MKITFFKNNFKENIIDISKSGLQGSFNSTCSYEFELYRFKGIKIGKDDISNENEFVLNLVHRIDDETFDIKTRKKLNTYYFNSKNLVKILNLDLSEFKYWFKVVFNSSGNHHLLLFKRALAKNIKNGECQQSLKEPINRLD